jgi:hypothetical protein
MVEFMKVVDLKYKMPSRFKVNSSVSQQFKKKCGVHVTATVDRLSDCRMRSYMGINVHFMTVNMQFKSYFLDFSYFVSLLGGILATYFLNTIGVINTFHLEKVCYVITDNAANMLNAFKDLTGMIQLADSVNDNDDVVDEPEELDIVERDDKRWGQVLM